MQSVLTVQCIVWYYTWCNSCLQWSLEILNGNKPSERSVLIDIMHNTEWNLLFYFLTSVTFMSFSSSKQCLQIFFLLMLMVILLCPALDQWPQTTRWSSGCFLFLLSCDFKMRFSNTASTAHTPIIITVPSKLSKSKVSAFLLNQTGSIVEWILSKM